MQFRDGFRSALLDGISNGENASGFSVDCDENDCGAIVLQLLCFAFQRRKGRDAFRFEETPSANKDMTILHAANHTAARDGFKQFGLCDGQVTFPGALHYCSRKRMFAALLKTGHDS